ncbi:MAG: hypothetical protein ABWK05_04530 [Pyrobaculum sp.]
MIEVLIYENDVAFYYKGRKILTILLYMTPLLHYVQHVAPHVARRLAEAKVYEFYTTDPAAGRAIELACRGACKYDPRGQDISAVLEEVYYNYLADRVLAYSATADALVVPCADQALARALAKRAREYAPDLALIASQYGGRCQLDHAHDPQPLDVPLPLGPVSRAALHTATWAVDEGIAEAPLTPLLDARCI